MVQKIDSFDYIGKQYDVPAYKGQRVKFEGKLGTIVGTDGARLMIEMDEKPNDYGFYHPSWHIEYIEGI